MRSPNIRYLPAVDHLRALAAVLIVVYHGLHLFTYEARFHRGFGIDHWLDSRNPLIAVLAEGHTAVALFMVLSGFILTRGALDGAIDARRFLRNRFLRTYPLFVLLVLAGVASDPAAAAPGALLRTLGGLANLPGAFVAPPYTSLLWTVAVEWQFYLLFPLLIIAMKAGWTRALLGLLAVLLGVRLVAWLGGGDARDLAYSTIVGRLDQFVLGMWSAWRFTAWAPSRAAAARLASGAALAIALTLWAFHADGGWPSTAGWKIAWPTVEGALWAAFIVGYVGWANAATGWWSRVLARVGEISYSIYLIHFVVIYAALRYAPALPSSGHLVVDALLETGLLVLPLTLLIATLTYRWVELPFLRLRGTYHREAGPA